MIQNRRRNNPQDMTLREQIEQKIENAQSFMCISRCKYYDKYNESLKEATQENYDKVEKVASNILDHYCRECEVKKL